MNRRKFLTAAAMSGLGAYAAALLDSKPRRVGLIGCGWYGKIDLLRLIQIAPVEVVSLCDVDRDMLANAADIVASTAAIEEKAAHLPRLSRHVEGARSGPGADCDTRSLARADVSRSREIGRGCLPAEADQRGRCGRGGDAGGGAKVSTRRAGGHAAAQHAASGRGARTLHPVRRASARSGWSKSIATTTCEPIRIRPTQPRPRTSITISGRVRRPCVHTTRSCIREGGAISTSTRTALWATCAFTCWT